jgi:hypothetical protein
VRLGSGDGRRRLGSRRAPGGGQWSDARLGSGDGRRRLKSRRERLGAGGGRGAPGSGLLERLRCVGVRVRADGWVRVTECDYVVRVRFIKLGLVAGFLVGCITSGPRWCTTV